MLAELAWPGHGPAELERWAQEHLHDRTLPPGADPVAVADYARVLAVQFPHPQEEALARSLYEAVCTERAWEELRAEHVEVLAHLRLLGGDPLGARELSSDPRLRADLAAAIYADSWHPRLAPQVDLARWAQSFNDALHSAALAPILPPEPGHLPHLDRMRVEPRPTVSRPERVTVMMSAYRRGPSLLTAVRSVLGQTWTELELLIVDDASGPGPGGEYAEMLAAAEAMDDRVRVIRKAVNGGTYRARNTALRQATGDFAIVIDSDDWWHPQTLELLAAPLLEQPGLMATRAEGVRLTPDLLLTRTGYRPRKPSAPTVLYRLPEVLTRMGFYDPTRKGSDNEHALRMEAAFGVKVLDIPETTTLLRGDGVTLSSEEFGNGWRHQARHQYKTLYASWHAEIARSHVSPYVDPDGPRAYPEPERWGRATHPLLEQPRELDLVLAGDWRRFGGPQRSMMEEIRAALAEGLTVGVMHLEALRFMDTKDRALAPEVVALIRSGAVRWVLPDDDLEVQVLLVRYPPILQYPPTLPQALRARHVLIVANQAPIEGDGSDPRYVVQDVTARAQELFGGNVRWLPQSPRIRQLLVEHDPEVALTDWDNPGIIAAEDWPVRRTRPLNAPIVVGRHSRDNAIKFPQTWDELLTGYRLPDTFEVRMLGSTSMVRALRRAAAGEDGRMPDLPDNWVLMPYGTQSVAEFLAGLDFFVYLDNPTAHESFGRTLLEAAASGVLTIAHPKHRVTFGEALDYAEPREVQDLILTYAADPQAYAERVERTLAAVAERFSPASFMRQIGALITRPQEPQPITAAVSVRLAPGQGPGTGAPGGHEDEDRVSTTDGSVVDVVRVPLRSAADAEHAESVTVVHAGLAEHTLGAWLRRTLDGWALASWDPGELLRTAPAAVVAVVLRRERHTWAVGRGRWVGGPRSGGGAPDLFETLPDGWGVTMWPDLEPPREVRLSAEHQEER